MIPINKSLISLAALVVSFSSLGKEMTNVPQGAVSDVVVERTEPSSSSLIVSMNIHPDVFPKKANREVWLTPVIFSGADTLYLDPVLIAGRTRYYQHIRGVLPVGDAVLMRAGAKDVHPYVVTVPYKDWMENSILNLIARVEGCCGKVVSVLEADPPIDTIDFRPKVLMPVMVYVSPTKDIHKTRSALGKAYIDFPVGKSVIYPDYRRNPAELGEIKRTIDNLRDDEDVTITSISFKGYASPEGSYANNERLAKARTEALIDYVRNLYSFPTSVMHASWVAEDWEGLAGAIEPLELTNKDAILGIVNNEEMAPDEKDNLLKSRFPEQYSYLLMNIYPTLRRADYQVEYDVRNYITVEEIAAVMAVAPQKLSLDELFLYAKSLDKDSPEFREVMEVAVRMFPDDPEANLNAATTAASFGDYDKAREYLSKAVASPVVTYTAGVIEAKQGNYAEAVELLTAASEEGVAEAEELLESMREFKMIPVIQSENDFPEEVIMPEEVITIEEAEEE